LFCAEGGGADTRLGKWQCRWHGKSQFMVVEITNIRFSGKWPDSSLYKYNYMLLQVFLQKTKQKWLRRKQSTSRRWRWLVLRLVHCRIYEIQNNKSIGCAGGKNLAADLGSRDHHARRTQIGTCRRFAGEDAWEQNKAAKYFKLPMGKDVRQIPVKWESRHHRA